MGYFDQHRGCFPRGCSRDASAGGQCRRPYPAVATGGTLSSGYFCTHSFWGSVVLVGCMGELWPLPSRNAVCLVLP